MECRVRVKGSGFGPTKNYIAKAFGAQRLESVMMRLPEKTREEFRNPLASCWYPVEYVGDLLTAIKAEFAGEKDIIYRISLESGKGSFSLAYRLFIKLGTPSFIIGKASNVWSTACDSGKLEVVESREKEIVVRLTGFGYKNPDYCGERLRGWFQAPLELSGCRNVTGEHITCTSRGGACCECRYRWS
jgi:hypothetical protein